MNGKLCSGIRKWPKGEKLMLIEAMQKVDTMVEQRVNKKEKNKEIKKENIEKARKKVIKKLKELAKGG